MGRFYSSYEMLFQLSSLPLPFLSQLPPMTHSRQLVSQRDEALRNLRVTA